MGAGRIVRAAVGMLDRMAAWLPKRQAEHLETGRVGEEAAYFFLRKLGYPIVAKNGRTVSRRGEIDLVGWDGETLCFVRGEDARDANDVSGRVRGGSVEAGRVANDGADVYAPDGSRDEDAV